MSNTMTPPPVYFDRAGDALPPDGCVVADTPAAWVRLAFHPEPLVVRGGDLCRRAEEFYGGRGRVCHELQSPRAALAKLGLSPVEGDALFNWLRDQWSDDFAARFGALQQPLRPDILLAVLFPNVPFGWNAPPSPSHAAAWLLWLDENLPDAPLQPLLAAHALGWREAATAPGLATLYNPCSAEGARALLRLWLGLETAGETFPTMLGPFPREVPRRWLAQAREEWQGRVGIEGFGLWETLRSRALLPASLRRVGAEVLARYFELQPTKLTAATIAALEGFLPDATQEKLREAVPPTPPTDLFADSEPPSPTVVLTWFKDEYWPFRHWYARRDDAAASAEAERLARAFALWYACFYASTLGSGNDIGMLAMRHSLTLRQRVQSERARGVQTLTLWLIADGLNMADAHTLVRHIEDKAPRLALEQDALAFCALPTVTPICKPALRWSSPPASAIPLTEADNPHEHRIKENAVLVEDLADAKPGELWVWDVVEPDRTYHKKFPPQTTLTKVAGELETLATRIAQVVASVPDELELHVVIATDHGRLPQSGPRRHKVPAGGESHGRAVLQKAGEKLEAPGWNGHDFVVEETAEGSRLWLNPHRFGLGAPAVLALDGAAFLENDGSGGTEHFAHGGAYPEEVIVPWIELVRDRATPRIEAHLSGRARAGGEGTLRLRLHNKSEVAAALKRMLLTFGPRDEREMDLEKAAPPLEPVEHPLPLERWPDGNAAERATCRLWFERPGGQRFEITATTALESEELYRRDSLLEEFD